MNQKHRRPGVETEAPDANEIGHSLSHLPRGSKQSVADLLRAIIALVESTPETEPAADTDIPMPAARIAELRPGTTATWLRTHVAEAGRGARRQALYRLSAVDRELESGARPPRPPRKSRPITGVNEAPLEQMIAHEELRATRGRR